MDSRILSAVFYFVNNYVNLFHYERILVVLKLNKFLEYWIRMVVCELGCLRGVEERLRGVLNEFPSVKKGGPNLL